MSYSVTSLPLLFCADYPTCLKVEVELPFGLPTFSFDDPCCEGLNITLDQLEGLLRPLIPFLKLLDCATKLISITMAIPDVIGPPPDIGKIVELIEAVADFVGECLPYILSLVPILPTAIIAFCKMIRGIARLILTILRCVKRVFVLNIAIAGDVLSLNTSIDPLLVNMGICLQGQNSSLNNSLLAKLGSLLNVFNLVNLVLEVLFTFIPPLEEAMTDTDPPIYPITANYTVSGSPLPTALLTIMDVLIVAFTIVEGATNICAGGG
jgi:hypothetical protein